MQVPAQPVPFGSGRGHDAVPFGPTRLGQLDGTHHDRRTDDTRTFRSAVPPVDRERCTIYCSAEWRHGRQAPAYRMGHAKCTASVVVVDNVVQPAR